MIAQQISNIPKFTKLLFLQDTFDSFLVSEATITTYNTFHIDGALNRSFYNEEEWAALKEEDFSSWKQLRPFCFLIIKGSKLPLSFKLIFRLSKKAMLQLLSKAEGDIPLVDGLFLNILYKNDSLTCSSGISHQEFTMDRTVEHLWDKTVSQFLEELE